MPTLNTISNIINSTMQNILIDFFIFFLKTKKDNNKYKIINIVYTISKYFSGTIPKTYNIIPNITAIKIDIIAMTLNIFLLLLFGFLLFLFLPIYKSHIHTNEIIT